MKTTYKIAEEKILTIEQDSYPESPRSWDNLATMLFFGEYSHLGDKHEHNIKASHYNGWGELRRVIEDAYDVACIVPIYAYIHSGMTISTTPFSCRWDSGQLGFAIITKKDLRNNYNIKRCTKKYKEYGIDIHIKNEVETLDQYVRGDVYSFEVKDKDENVIDSCSGFYGSDILTNGILDHILTEDREIIEKEINNY
jgi:hypothetical protein